MKNNDDSRRRQRVERNMAYQKTFIGLKQKLPIFLVAAVAGISLSILDSSKASYQTAKNSPIEVNDTFIKSVKQGMWIELLNEPYHFKYHKFANPGDLIDTLATKAIANNAAQQARLDAAQRQLQDPYERDKVKFTSAKTTALRTLDDIDKQKKTLLESSPNGKTSQLKKLQRDSEAANRTIADSNVKLRQLEIENAINAETYATKTQKLSEDSRLKIDAIYNDFGSGLSSTVLLVQNKPMGLFESLLKPILDEQSSLYVIFQILKITALILLVLSFVFVLVMALGQLPLANASETLSDQLRGLISLKGGGGGDAARAAVLSVAALGVGTAAVVAGNSINDKADRALEIATASAIPATSDNPFLRNAYYRNNAYRSNSTNNWSKSSFSSIYNSTTNIDGEPIEGETPIFSPTNNITVPPPVVQIVRVSDTAGTRALVNQLTAIGARLPLTEVVTLKNSMLKVQEDISSIKSGLSDFRSGATSAIAKIGNIDSSLTTLSLENTNAAAAQYMLSFHQNDKLDLINTNIDGLRRDNLTSQPRSAGRNFTTRASQFFGGETFSISEQAYQGIRNHFPKTQKYDAILAGLQEIKYQLPVDKGRFLRNLGDATSRAAKNDKETLDLLKSWEAVILSYARLPR